MTALNFVYWLNGLLELSPDLKTLNEDQVKMIRDHIGLVLQRDVYSVNFDPQNISNPRLDLKKLSEESVRYVNSLSGKM